MMAFFIVAEVEPRLPNSLNLEIENKVRICISFVVDDQEMQLEEEGLTLADHLRGPFCTAGKALQKQLVTLGLHQKV